MEHCNDDSKLEARILTRPFFILLSLSLVGLFFIGVRFTKGIGAVSNLSDGYPWGIWVAYDVAIGTAIACGGYAVAVLSYILNRWHYHQVVGSAVLTSLFGSCLAAFSVVVDIGRPWNAYGYFIPTRWQPTSAFFELALCIAGYGVVQAIEFLPVLLSAPDRGTPSGRRTCALRWARKRLAHLSAASLQRRLNIGLICIVIAGIFLPTLHQSALGSLMLIASTKLHPLWHTAFLPLLFLINCIYIGFAIVILESVVASFFLSRDYQSTELAALARLIPWVTCSWLVIRIADLARRDQLSAVFHGDFYSGFFLAEFFLMAAASAPLLAPEKRRSPRWLFVSAALMLIGGALYRFNVYLIGFDPGTGWHYFPSFAEVMISVGIVSLELLSYQILMKALPHRPEAGQGGN